MSRMTKREIAQMLGTGEAGIRQALADLMGALDEEVARREQVERQLSVCEEALLMASNHAAKREAQALELARRCREMREAGLAHPARRAKTRRRL